MSLNLKNCIYISKLGLWVEFKGEFFMVYEIDIHELNNLKFNAFG
jgi:hypothetical protein